MRNASSKQRWHSSRPDCLNNCRPAQRAYARAAPVAPVTSTGIRTGVDPPVYFAVITGAVARSIFLPPYEQPPRGNRCGGESRLREIIKHHRVTCRFDAMTFT
jgi:hypothetical protein